MLPRAHRLRRSSEFATVVRGGSRVGTSAVVVSRRLRDDDEPTRVGFVVGRAVGPAVTRNTVKRRLRALVAERLDSLPRHCSLVVRANPPAAQASYADLAGALDRCLDRLARRRSEP